MKIRNWNQYENEMKIHNWIIYKNEMKTLTGTINKMK